MRLLRQSQRLKTKDQENVYNTGPLTPETSFLSPPPPRGTLLNRTTASVIMQCESWQIDRNEDRRTAEAKWIEAIFV